MKAYSKDLRLRVLADLKSVQDLQQQGLSFALERRMTVKRVNLDYFNEA